MINFLDHKTIGILNFSNNTFNTQIMLHAILPCQHVNIDIGEFNESTAFTFVWLAYNILLQRQNNGTSVKQNLENLNKLFSNSESEKSEKWKLNAFRQKLEFGENVRIS